MGEVPSKLGPGFPRCGSLGPLFLEHHAHQARGHHTQGHKITIAPPPGAEAGPSAGGLLPATAAASQVVQEQQDESAQGQNLLQPNVFQASSGWRL